MFPTIVCFIILIWGWIQCGKRKEHLSILVFFFFFSQFFSLLFFKDVAIKGLDFCYVYCAGLMLYGYKKDKHFFSLKRDIIAQLIVITEVYFLLNFIVTVASGIEYFTYALKEYRTHLFLFCYFWLRSIPVRCYLKSYKYLFYISLILGIFFYLQMVGIELLINNSEESTYRVEFQRIRNIPITMSFIMILLPFVKIKSSYKYLLYIFFGGILAFSQHRGMMLALVMAMPIGMIFMKSYKKLASFAALLIGVAIVFSPILLYRFSGKGGDGTSLAQEIENGLSMRSTKNAEVDGTFTFRTYLIIERIEYLINNPQYLFTGVGARHEESPNTPRDFNFKIGTRNIDKYGRITLSQLDSVDVGLIGIIFRYGLIGFILTVLLFVLLFKQYWRKYNIAAKIGLIFLLYCIFRLLSGNEFTPFNYSLFLTCGIISHKIEIHKNKLYNPSLYEDSSSSSHL